MLKLKVNVLKIQKHLIKVFKKIMIFSLTISSKRLKRNGLWLNMHKLEMRLIHIYVTVLSKLSHHKLYKFLAFFLCLHVKKMQVIYSSDENYFADGLRFMVHYASLTYYSMRPRHTLQSTSKQF